MLTNQGYASCYVSELGVRAGLYNQGDFSLSQPPELPQTLRPTGQPDSSVRIEIVFTPLEIGQHLAALWIVSNDPDLQIGADEERLEQVGLLGRRLVEPCFDEDTVVGHGLVEAGARG